MALAGDILSNFALVRAIHFDTSSMGKGAAAPTLVDVGASPAVEAILFDATNEVATVVTSLRPEMDLESNFTLKILFSLVDAQTNLDQLDLTLDYVVFRSGVTGDGPDKPSTQITTSLQVTTGEGLAVNDVYAMNVTLAFDDATNPINAAGASGIAVEFHLTNLTEVSAIHVLDVDLEYTALF